MNWSWLCAVCYEFQYPYYFSLLLYQLHIANKVYKILWTNMIGSKLNKVFLNTLLLVRILCVLKGIISDCDEVFNYWEPLNLLVRYFGKQTWEYSPEFAIRSWAYLVPYMIFNYPIKLINAYSNTTIPPYYFFYAVRFVNTALLTLGEIRLAEALNGLSTEFSKWFLIFQIFNPGMSHASIALLPSSFSLMLNLYSTASIINYIKYNRLFSKATHTINIITSNSKEESIDKEDKDYIKLTSLQTHLRTAKNSSFAWVMFYAALGAVLGWPFTLVLYAPFVIYCSIDKLFHKEYIDLLLFGTVGFAAITFISIASVQIDWYLYKLSGFIPYNIVAYNVLNTSSESGPNIFGTEPLSYYILNLLLNFNIIIPLSLVGLTLSMVLASYMKFKFRFLDFLVVLSPVYVWCGVFFAQPHKEERFLYPIYHLISLSGSLGITTLSNLFGSGNFFTYIYSKSSKFAVFLVVALLSSSRIAMLINNYSAPLTVFRELSQVSSISDSSEVVCMGREWYHYPSSFFLKDNQRLQFVENGFRGMLPGDFPEPENTTWSGLAGSISHLPTHFNDKNQYNPDLVTSFQKCDYYVDLDIPVDTEMGEKEIFKRNAVTGLVSVPKNWELVTCSKFIDSSKSSGLFKILYVPSEYADLINTNLLKLSEFLKLHITEKNLLSLPDYLPLVVREKFPSDKYSATISTVFPTLLETLDKAIQFLEYNVEYDNFCLTKKKA